MNQVQSNLIIVLGRLVALVSKDEDFASYLAEDLEILLDQIASDDGFGTEQQNDPRGDFRDAYWSLLGEVQ